MSLGTGRLMALMFPTVMTVVNVSSVAVVWFGAHRIDSGDMQIGALTAFLSYLMQIVMSVMMATFMFMMVPRAEVCAERIQEVLDTESSVVPPSAPVRTAAPARPSGAARRGVPLSRVPRSRCSRASICWRGPARRPRSSDRRAAASRRCSVSSRGCSTPPRAPVLVDGEDVRKLDPELLARTVGVVPQKPYLFSGTVASNLRYGRPDATRRGAVAGAGGRAGREFVAALEGGLDAPIAQGGTNVSGGQRQRLAIARVLVQRPEIYLFDDSFSALDYATDAALRAALARETAEATVVIVAQRVATIRDADRILVLDEGRVVGSGRHQELMAGNETYREIVLSQLTEQEAA